MRPAITLSMILLLAALGGCTSHQSQPPFVQAPPPPEDAQGEAVVASSLIFDPPITADMPPLDLSREARQPQAIIGYDGDIQTVFNIRTEDEQRSESRNGNGDRFERRAVMERFGVSYR